MVITVIYFVYII